jgi:hypothetical protein
MQKKKRHTGMTWLLINRYKLERLLIYAASYFI